MVKASRPRRSGCGLAAMKANFGSRSRMTAKGLPSDGAFDEMGTACPTWRACLETEIGGECEITNRSEGGTTVRFRLFTKKEISNP